MKSEVAGGERALVRWTGSWSASPSLGGFEAERIRPGVEGRRVGRPGRRFPLLMAVLALVAAPAAGFALSAAPHDSLSPAEVLRQQNARLDSLLLPESTSFDTSGIDSVLLRIEQEGFEAFRKLGASGEPKRQLLVSVVPLSFASYNRIEGVRPSLGLDVARGPGIRAAAAAGYGFSNHRWVGKGNLTLGRPTEGPQLQVEAGEMVVPFGPTRIDYGAGILSLIAGQDRQDYLRRKEVKLTTWPVRGPRGSAYLSGFHREDFTVRARTDFRLFGGGTPIQDPNPSVDPGRVHGVILGGTFRPRGDLLELAARAGVAGGGLGGDFAYSWREGSATLRPVFPDGGVLNVSLEGADVGGAVPFQALPFLGGDGNLRGYGRLEYAGRRRLSTRIEYETGIDILARTKVRFLKSLRLQFIPFVDAGSTWGEAPSESPAPGALDGKIRSSAGLGIQRQIWIPGIKAMRFDVIHRNDGAKHAWSYWFRIFPLRSE